MIGRRIRSAFRAMIVHWHGSLAAARNIPPVVPLVAVGLTATSFLLPFFTKHFVDDFLVPETGTWLWPLLVGMIAAGGLRAALVWFQRSALLTIQIARSTENAGRVFDHLVAADRRRLGAYRAGDLANILRGQDKAARIIYADVMNAVVDLPSVPFLFAIMAWFDLRIAAAALCLTLFNAGGLWLVARRRARISDGLAEARGAFAGTLTGHLRVMPAVKAGVLEDAVFAEWTGAHRRQANRVADLGLLSERLGVLPGLLSGLSLAAILGIGALGIMDGALSTGDLVACQTLFFSINDPIRRLIDASGLLQEANAELRRRRVVETIPRDPWLLRPEGPADCQEHSASTTVDRPPAVEGEDIVIHDPGPNSPEGQSQPLGFFVPSGAQLGLLGRSGTGKSALCRMIAGLDSPHSGTIRLYGRVASGLSRRELAAAVGYVGREVAGFSGPLRRVLSLWDDDTPSDALWAAMATAGIDEVVRSRPGGLDAWLGPGGLGLSGGQMQRLNIARALVTRPRIIILDEALEALDAALARRIMGNLRQREITTIVVSHRAEVIGECDSVLSLDHRNAVTSSNRPGPGGSV